MSSVKRTLIRIRKIKIRLILLKKKIVKEKRKESELDNSKGKSKDMIPSSDLS